MGGWCWLFSLPSLGLAAEGPGAMLVPQVGHLASVRQVSLNEDGSRVVSAGRDGAVVLWHTASGAMLRRLVVEGDVLAASFADGGDSIVAVTSVGRWFTWETATGELVSSDRVVDNAEKNLVWSSARFVDEGRRVLAALTDGGARIYKPNGRHGGLLEGVDLVRAQSATPNGRFVAARVGEREIGVFRGRSGARIRSLVVDEGDEPVGTVAISPDGDRVVVTDDTPEAKVWSARTTGEPAVLLLADEGRRHVDAGFTAEGRVVTMDDRSTFRRYEGVDAVQTFASGAYVDRGMILSPEGLLAAPEYEGGVGVWQLSDGEAIRHMRGSVRPVAVVTERRGRFAVGHYDGMATVWSAPSGGVQRTYEIGDEPVIQLQLHDYELLLGITSDRAVVYHTGFGSFPVFALDKLGSGLKEGSLDFTGDKVFLADPFGARGWPISRFRSAPLVGRRDDWGRVRANGEAIERVSTFDARPDPERLPGWLALDDDELFVIDEETGERRASLYMFDDGNWAVVDVDGRFDAGDTSLDGLRWIIDGLPYDLAQLRDRYYEPGLLAKILGFNDEPLREVPPLSTVEAPPVVHLDGPTADGTITLRVEDRGSGFGGLFATLNGSDVTRAIEGACPALAGGEPCTVSLADRPTWMPGRDNEVRIEGFSASGVLRSRALTVSVTAAGSIDEDAPDLWVLAVGSGDYSGDALDLKYAAQDASRLAHALSVAGARGFGRDRTHVRVLSTDPAGDVHAAPSRRALEEGFAWLAGSDPLDTVIVYFSGHGVAFTDGAVDDYFYLLPDAGSLEDVRDPSVRPLRTFSGADLARIMTTVPALKRVIILDTCAAGKVDAELSASRAALSSDVIRAHARSRERTGAWLLAGAAADKVSYEASRFGQGVLTYSLIEGMLGPALDNADLLMVGRWLSWAEAQVPRHAAGIGGVQEPVTRRGSAYDFPLGQLPPEDRRSIPLRKVRPVMVSARVVGRGGRQDTLRCTEAIDAQLRSIGGEEGAAFVHWDSDPIAKTWQITGTCARVREEVVFEGFLTLAGDTPDAPASEVALEARGADPEEVAARIVARAARLVRGASGG